MEAPDQNRATVVLFMVDVAYVEIETPDQNRVTVVFFMVDVEYVESHLIRTELQ